MASFYKVLGQVNPTANTDTTLYTVPASRSTVVSTINVCNMSTVDAQFRIAVRPLGATLALIHYVCFDVTVPGNDSVTLTMGMTLATTDVITVRANSTTVTFNAFGSEIS